MNQLSILYVEDNEDDVLLLRFAFKRADILNPLHFAQDGQEAIDYLAGAGKFSDRAKYPIPSLVLLDLKLPKKMRSEERRVGKECRYEWETDDEKNKSE